MKHRFSPTLTGTLSGCCLCCLLSMGMYFPAQGQTADEVRAGLLQDIQVSQRQLEQAQRRVTAERHTLAQQLSELEREVEKLRQDSAEARRTEDEKTLSLTVLEKRLQQWQDQSRYQHNLLGNLAKRFLSAAAAQTLNTQPWQAQLRWLESHGQNLAASLDPHWQQQEIVTGSGELLTAEALRLGPLHWFVLREPGLGGLLDTAAPELPPIQLLLDNDAVDDLLLLQQQGRGMLTFDPTLTRALQLEQQRESLLRHLTNGGIWVIPILTAALVALVTALLKGMQLWRLPALDHKLPDRIAGIMTIPAVEDRRRRLTELRLRLKGMQGPLLAIALDTPLGQVRDDRLLNLIASQRQRLEHWLGTIAVIAAIAPLLGLLGTVSGMIETFQLMTLFGAGDPQAVSSGISKALITTELGLVVAIPALLLHAVLSKRVKSCCNVLEANAVQFSQMPTGSPAP